MPSTPRKTIDPEFIADLDCPICGRDQLAIKSLANYPDFISCGNCDSQFAVEQGGDRIMYGKIPAAYPRTSRFALQQWVWPEAIARRAADERPEPIEPAGSPISETSPTEEAPPTSEPAESDITLDSSEPELLPSEELDPDQVFDDQLTTLPEDGVEEQTILGDFSPAAEDPGTPEVPLVDEPEPTLQEPPGEEGPPAPADLQSQDIVQEAESSSSPEEIMDEAMLEDSTLEVEADYSAPAIVTEAEPFPTASEPEDAAPEEEFADLEDLFQDQIEDPPSDIPAHEGQENIISEEPSAEFEEEPSEPTATTLPEGFDEIASEPEPTTDLPEGDFSFFEQTAESESPDPWDAPESAAEGIFTPPFGEGEPEETDDLPEDYEPAPPMPDWLGAEKEITDEAEEAEEDMAAIDFTSLRDEPADEFKDTSFGEEEDLLASLWDDEEESPAEDTESIDVEDELAAFAGLGAIDEEFEDETAAVEQFDEDTVDFWADEEETELTSSTEILEQETEPLPEAEADSGLSAQEEIARRRWGGDQAVQGPDPVKTAIKEDVEKAKAGEISFEPEEPPPGQRFRVVLQNHQAQFPDELCAHCSQSPTIARLSATASVYRGAGVGDRQVVTYRLPVCAECRDRAKARSDERQTAQLQAHLISVLIAMILVVSALAFRLVDFQDRIGFDLAILLLLAGMGYAIPVAFLLIRASRIGKPADAKYVESTLRVPGDTEGAETAFEFRNKRYAYHFLQENEKIAISEVNKVRERQYEQE